MMHPNFWLPLAFNCAALNIVLDGKNMASAPLLVGPNCQLFKGNGEVPELGRSRLGFSLSQSQVVLEIKLLYMIALPVIISGLLNYGKSFISMLFLGMLGKDALAGGSLAIGIANITGYSVISGLAQGMDAISSQAFGANRCPLMAQTLFRTIIILIFACVPISVLWLNIEPVLIFFKQDPTISSIAATYLTFCLPDLLFQSLINPIRIFLRSQNITSPIMTSAAIGLIFHAPVNYLFINCLHLSVPGVAIVAALTDLILIVVLALYLYIWGIDLSLAGSLGPFQEWKSIIGLALPSCCAVCLEWWWYELMILLCGVLDNGPVAVATMGIIIQATSLAYIFPSSLSQGVSTRVGNELGANRPNQARISSWVSLLCAAFTGVIAMSFMVGFASAWGRAFTDDGAIVRLTATVLPVVGLCELGNCPQTTGCGALRGSARPDLGLRINLGAFYGVGLPVALLLGFWMEMGLLGFMIGLLSAQAVCSVVMIWALFSTDWVEQVGRARDLIGVEGSSDYDGTAVNGDGDNYNGYE